MNLSDIHGAFERLNLKLVYAHAEFGLVVCGGAALIVAGLIRRVTADVDVLALAHDQTAQPLATLEPITELPPELLSAASDVGRDLGLDPNWLNAGPAKRLSEIGLPAGIEHRLTHRKYGSSLVVYFLHRLDQVHLKLFASMDPSSGVRHMSDLIELSPTRDEAATAARWLLSRTTSQDFRKKLAETLERLSHEDVLGEV